MYISLPVNQTFKLYKITPPPPPPKKKKKKENTGIYTRPKPGKFNVFYVITTENNFSMDLIKKKKNNTT